MQQNGAPNNETVSAKVDSVPNFNIFSTCIFKLRFRFFLHIETQIYLLYLFEFIFCYEQLETLIQDAC